MTLTQIRTELLEHSGNATDLSDSELTNFANRGQRAIAFWKDPSTGVPVRFRALTSELYFQSKVIEATLDDDGTTTTVVLPSDDVGSQDDRYNGWVVEINGESRVVMDYTGSTTTATVHEAFSSVPESGDSYKLYKRFFYFLPASHDWMSSPSGEHIQLPSEADRYRAEGNFLEPLKIEDLADEHMLTHATRVESFTDFTNDVGDPTEWLMFGKRLMFDRNVDEAKWFRMEYYRLPTDMSADSDEPELPEQFHQAIVLWGAWAIYRRKMESSAAYSTKRDLVDYMRATQSEFDVTAVRMNPGMELRGDYVRHS